MSFKKIAAWFLTDAGKKFSYYVTGAATTTSLLAHILPQTIFLDKYKDVVHLYKKGFSVPLSPKLQERFQKALELVEIDENDRHLFKPFPVYGFEIFSAGSSYSSYGVIVGIPINFTYESVETVDKQVIKQIRDTGICWETPEGSQLLNSLTLSENAQLYAMAREIKFRETPKLMIDTACSVFSITGAYGLANAINVKLNLYARPLILRLCLYSLVGTFIAGVFFLCKDASQVYFEQKIDNELKAKNSIFVEGGKEFYGKLIERNKALRKLLGKEGESAYTVLGNENYLIRHKHTPLVQRKLLFDS